MNLICLNAWGGAMADALLPWLAAQAPDILCLQEVIHTPGAGAVWATYRDDSHVLPQRANLMAEVAALLPGHRAFFCPAARGPLWVGDRTVPSFWGLATFVADHLIVTAQAQGFVHGTFSPGGYGDHPRSRPGHALRLFDSTTDRVLSLAQMHGLRDPAGKGDSPARDAQAERFLRLADRVAEPGDLRILCGDFNVGPDSRTLARMAARGFTDLVTAGGFPGTRTSAYPKPMRHADYLLVDRPGQVVDFDVLRDPEVSDHCPLILML
ncbi:MAG: endonuclease/exonuclease/phosphatase family protein [Gemmobacter sp.]